MRGYHHQIAHVDLDRGRVDQWRPGESMLRRFLGGRGLGAAILSAHGAGVEPLSPESLVCFASGPLTGTDVPLSNRLAMVFRSPLTGTIAWAMTGGYIASEFKRGGLDALAVTGRSAEPCYLSIRGAEIEIRSARTLWGAGAVETVGRLQEVHPDAHVLSIGPAGERLSPMATVINDRGRASGVRHGIGAVLGSKGLKAIVVRPSGAPKTVPANVAAQRALLARLQAAIRASPLLNPKTGTLAVHGTPSAVEALGASEALPTENYRYTRMLGYEEIGGLRMSQTILRERLTCAHCPVQCRREVGADGKYRYVTEGPDYAQLSSLGSNCRVRDLPALGYMNHLCYELGLDPIEMGNTLAMLAEATEHAKTKGGLGWGDVDRMIELIQSTGTAEGIGETLALGASQAAARLGVPELAMAVKGVSIQNVDPRPEPAWGLLNATETFGAAAHIWTYADLVEGMRHAGVVPRVSADSPPRQIAQAVRDRQDLVAVLDSVTSCAFASYAFSLDDYAEALTLATDEPFTAAELLESGSRIFGLERQFNLANGFTPRDDTLPARFTYEGVPDGRHQGKVCDLEPLLDEYYAQREWRRADVADCRRHARVGVA